MKCLIQATVLFLIFTIAHAGPDLARIEDPGWRAVTLKGIDCRGTEEGYGPFDWRRTTEQNRRLVEKIHFTADVESLRKGSTGSVEHDLDYTLMAFPNHHRALWAYAKNWIERYPEVSLSYRTELAKQGTPPPECYFIRAIKAVPGDPVVRMAFGVYLHKRDKLDLALEQYEAVEQMNDSYAELAYNMGLLYLERRDITKARTYSDKATALGYPLRGLDRELRKLENEKTKAVE